MRKHAWAVGLLLAAVLAVYADCLRNGFTFDDPIYILRNPFLRDASNLKVLADPRFYLGTHEVLMGSRPVVLASLLIDRALWGFSPAGFHATNVLLHVANTLWVYALAFALGLSGLLPFWAALLFGLHPAATEAVDGILFRSDLLACFFALAALWFYLKARGRDLRGTLACLAGSALLFGLGLLSKEMAATLPLLALLAEAFFPARAGRTRRIAIALGAWTLVALAFLGFWAPRFRHPGVPAGAVRATADRLAAALPTAPGEGTLKLGLEKGHQAPPSVWEFRAALSDPKVLTLTMLRAVADYSRILLAPWTLVADRAPVIVRDFRDASAVLGLLWLLAVAGFAVAFRRRFPAAAFGAAWCLAALLPVLNIVPLYNPVAERYLYFLCVGAALALATAVAGAGRASTLAGCCLAAFFGLRTAARNLDWKDDRTLFLEAVAPERQSARSALVRGELLKREGRLEEARREYEDALRRVPELAEGWYGLAGVYEAAGDKDLVKTSYERAMALAPKNAAYPFSYGFYLDRAGQKPSAEAQYRHALELEPEFVEALVNLGALYRDTGRFAQARACFEKALAAAPADNPMPSYSYALLLEKTGDRRAAAARYEDALRRNAAFEPARVRLTALQGAR